MKQLVILFLLGLVISTQCASLKDHVKKGSKGSKTRSELVVTEAGTGSPEDPPPQDPLPEKEEGLETVANALPLGENSISIADLEEGDIAAASDGAEPSDSDSTEVEVIDVEGNSFLSRFRRMIRRVLEMFGIRYRSKVKESTNDEDAESRMIGEQGSNGLELWRYKDEVRMTIGALLGREDCMRRVACSAGTYLRRVKGKEIVLVILDKVTPNTWRDTYRVIKDSAIRNEACEFTCLDED